MKAFAVVAAWALLIPFCAAAAPVSDAPHRPTILFDFRPGTSVTAASDRALVVKAAQGEPRIDGVLDDDCWQHATLTTGFYAAADGKESAPATSVLLCHSPDTLYVGIAVDEAPSRQDVQLLFDSLHDETTFDSITIHPAGTHTDSFVAPGSPEQAWKGEAVIAVNQQAARWTAEIALKKAALPDPENGIWGFNIARQVPDHPETLATWNKVIGDPRRPDAFGHLAFEAKPCYIKAAMLAFPHRGRNRLDVAVINTSPVNAQFNAAIIVRQEDGKQSQNRYKFPLNTSEGEWLSFDFGLESLGKFSLEFDAFDPQNQTWLARIVRRGLTVKPMIALDRDVQVDPAGVVTIPLMLNVPPELLTTTSLSLTLRAKAERATKAFAQTTKVLSDRPVATIDATSLAPGAYLVRVTTAVASLGSDSLEASFVIPRAVPAKAP